MNGSDDKESGLKTLLALGSAVTGFAAVLGSLVFTGLLARFPRNHPHEARWSFALVVIAAGLWTAASLSTWAKKTSRRENVLLLGIAVFMTGLIVAVWAIFGTYSEDEKPSVSMRFENNNDVVAEVTARGLASHEQIGVKLLGLRRNADFERGWEPFTLYDATFGPDTDGTVQHSIKVPIAPGTYELVEIRASTDAADTYTSCLEKEKVRFSRLARELGLQSPQTGGPKRGCLVFTLPRIARVPELDARLRDGANALDVDVAAENAAYRAALQVATRSEGGWRLLSRELLMPDRNGAIAFQREWQVPAATRRVCVLTTWYRSGETWPPLKCPRRTDNETAWALLRI